MRSAAGTTISDIKSRTDCIDILSRYGIHAKQGINISCPLGKHEDKNPSFNLYAGGEKFKCFSCGASGDALDLEAAMSGQGLKEVIQTLTGGEIRKLRTHTRPPDKPREITLKNDFSEYVKDYQSATYNEICADLWELSDFRPDYPTDQNPAAEGAEFLRALYEPEDFLFIGSQFDAKNPERVKSRDEWIMTIQADGVKFPLICVNPVHLEGTANGNGETSFRTAANIAKHKYSLIENDRASLRDQAAFWLKMIQSGFPVRALIFSGNKSLHAIFEANPE
ncbi:MAG: CHC2 zinc finger domain-containing protein, partial [Victivallales bacterium]